jgi:hypothetical protein
VAGALAGVAERATPDSDRQRAESRARFSQIFTTDIGNLFAD